MALAYLLDPCQQYSNRAGVNNVNGYFEVFRMDTDDRATVYVDFNGTLAPEHIGIDNDGRAVMIVESGRPYRVEMHGPSGDLFWTQQPVWPLAGGGGGVSGTDIVSSDGSISVDRTTVGSVTTYDLSSNVEDGTDLLGWVRCDGASNVDGTDIWKPTYTAGTLTVGERGVMLAGGQYFHATARVRVMKSAVSGFYDDMQLIFKLSDGGTSTEVARQGIVVDGSMSLYQDFEISCDTLPESDCELVLEITGKELTSLNIQVLDMEVHRVFSGAPYIPGGVASKTWINENFQEKLTAGDNITIENNVISATGGGSGGTYTAGSGININSSNVISVDSSVVALKIDLSQYVTDSDLETILEGYATASDLQAGLAAKQDTISDLSAIRAGAQAGATAVQPADLDTYATYAELTAGLATKQDVINDLSEIRSGASAGSTALQPSDVAPVAISGDYDSLVNKPTIPSGTQLVPAATSADADKVLTVDSQGVPEWADAQAPISAGNGISISNNVVSAKVDGTTVTINASGQLQASAPVTVDQTYDPTSTNPQSGTAVAGAVATKQDTLTAGTNISISGSTISATDTTYSAGTGLELTGTTFSVDSTTVAMKSDLPDLTDYVTDTELSTILEGYQTALSAGSNIQISNGTISATDTTYTAGTGLDLTGTEFSVDTTTIATKADLADYTPTASLGAVALSNDYDDLDNKPTIPVVPPTKELVAGNNITLTEGQDSVTISATSATYTAGTGISINNGVIANTAPNVKSDWNAASGSDAEILNKPTIPTLPATKNLVAGNNLTVTEGLDSVTLDVTGIPTIGTVEV